MTNQTETPQEQPSQWDPFPEPSTIPAGWDLSEYLDHSVLNRPVEALVSFFDKHFHQVVKKDVRGR